MSNLNRIVSRSLPAAFKNCLCLLALNTTILSSALAQNSAIPAIKKTTHDQQVAASAAFLKNLQTNKGLHFSKEIPVNFPIPEYKSNVLNKAFLNTTKGSPRASVSIRTKDSAANVAQWYTEFFKRDKWSLKVPTAKAQAKLSAKGEIYMMEATKDTNFVHVFCTPKKDKTATNIMINWEKKPQA